MSIFRSRVLLSLIVGGALLIGCNDASSEDNDGVRASSARADEPALKDSFEGLFMIGAAVNQWQVEGRDPEAVELVRHHFNSLTPENVMKWEHIHPEPGRYDFEAADAFVDFATENDMFIIGHTLVWHSQTPRWVFQDDDGNPLTREALLERMRDHIHTVVGRYRGRIPAWDVVNEALNEDGTLRESPWYRIIGPDFIQKAFEFAREADPDAELYYNDYSLENVPKRQGAIRLVQSLLDAGAPITGLGSQLHGAMDWPSVGLLDSTIVEFGELGIDVMYTELDIDVLPREDSFFTAEVSIDLELRPELNPYEDGLPEERQQALANRYREIFEVFVNRSDIIGRVTFWGVTDGDSWLNNWPIRGRTSYPLLFDRDYQPKPAFHAVVETAE